jgi:hypothetical protein
MIKISYTFGWALPPFIMISAALSAIIRIRDRQKISEQKLILKYIKHGFVS